jgi:RHS repeat-associated protein
VFTLGGQAPAVAQTGETIEYYALDAVGSVRAVFEPSGALIGRIDFMPFGEELGGAAPKPKERFAGLFRDGEAGLDFAGARSYQSRTGRFTAPDPVYAGLVDPQGWNRYAYALNAPLTFVDPSGLQAEAYPASERPPSSERRATNGASGMCDASYSYASCGGDDLFWGGGGGFFEFGNDSALAQQNGYVPGMSADLWGSLSEHLQRVEETIDAWKFSQAIDLELLRYADENGIDTGLTLGATPGGGVAGMLTAIATVAASVIPRAGNTAATYGTRVHSLFERVIRAINRPELRAEISFKNGIVVDRGTPGSVRLDAVVMRGRQIDHIFDLKTGGSSMSPARIQQIYSELGGQRPPIHIIRPR